MSHFRSVPKSEAKAGFGWDRDLALIWGGMVVGVSFLATPAKFRVKSLPRPLALEVGRETFRVLAQVEAVPSVLLALRSAAVPARRLLAPIPGAIVLAQALWLRPRLAARTRQIVAGAAPPPAPGLHLAYVACELTKLAALLGFGLAAARPPRSRDRRALS